MIDWQRVEELRDEIGAEDFDEVLELFLSEVDNAIETLAEAVGVVTTTGEQMHFLKGAGLNLGFAAMAELCQKGEKAATTGDAYAVSPDAVRACFEASKAEFTTEYTRRFAA